MDLPAHIADRIRTFVATTGKDGMHVDNEAARYGGISLMGTIGATWLMRPDGSLWDVDDDFGKPLQPLPQQFHVTALVAGSERHEWLAELLPQRPSKALDCTTCAGHGHILLKSEPGPYCSRCNALGWIVPTDG
ncbi:MAG TPA: hypothetical protein VGI10_01640 [Polyangiaceae bacterium]|jgi:hypothetical protein